MFLLRLGPALSVTHNYLCIYYTKWVCDSKKRGISSHLLNGTQLVFKRKAVRLTELLSWHGESENHLIPRFSFWWCRRGGSMYTGFSYTCGCWQFLLQVLNQMERELLRSKCLVFVHFRYCTQTFPNADMLPVFIKHFSSCCDQSHELNFTSHCMLTSSNLGRILQYWDTF